MNGSNNELISSAVTFDNFFPSIIRSLLMQRRELLKLFASLCATKASWRDVPATPVKSPGLRHQLLAMPFKPPASLGLGSQKRKPEGT